MPLTTCYSLFLMVPRLIYNVIMGPITFASPHQSGFFNACGLILVSQTLLASENTFHALVFAAVGFQAMAVSFFVR